MTEYIYFLRHGETDYNVKHRLQGQKNTELNENGRCQAREAGEKFRQEGIRFSRVYVSPLDRAQETAALASGFPREELRTDDRLIELDFGPIEGKVYEDLPPAEKGYVDAPWENAPVPGTETPDHIIARVRDFLTMLASEERQKEKSELSRVPEAGGKSDPAENILVVTHGMALHAILTALPGPGRSCWRIPLSNCCVFRTELSEGEYTQPVRLTEPAPTFH